MRWFLVAMARVVAGFGVLIAGAVGGTAWVVDLAARLPRSWPVVAMSLYTTLVFVVAAKVVGFRFTDIADGDLHDRRVHDWARAGGRGRRPGS